MAFSVCFGVSSGDWEGILVMALFLLLGSTIVGGIVTVPLGGLLLGLWQRKALSASRWS